MHELKHESKYLMDVVQADASSRSLRQVHRSMQNHCVAGGKSQNKKKKENRHGNKKADNTTPGNWTRR